MASNTINVEIPIPPGFQPPNEAETERERATRIRDWIAYLEGIEPKTSLLTAVLKCLNEELAKIDDFEQYYPPGYVPGAWGQD